MDIDEEGENISEESEEDDEEIRNLKARRKYLKNLLQNSLRLSHLEDDLERLNNIYRHSSLHHCRG